MATEKRIQKDGNYIIITDENDVILFEAPSFQTSYHTKQGQIIVSSDANNIPNVKTINGLTAEWLNSVGGALSGGAIDWLRNNTGFNSASGGSGASESDKLYLGFSGQSGMNCITIGVDGGGDESTNPNVFVWNETTQAWVVADLFAYPIGERFNGVTSVDGNNNLAFHTAKRIQEATQKTIYMIFDAFSGVPISDWVGSGTSSANWLTFADKISDSGIPRLDGYFWKQGEAENSSNPDLAIDYADNLRLLINQVNAVFPERVDNIPFVACELAEQFELNDVFYSYNQWAKYFNAGNFGVAIGRHLETLVDNVHLTGASVVLQASSAANVFLTLPRNPRKMHIEEYYDSSNSKAYIIPYNSSNTIHSAPKIGDEQVFHILGTGNITFGVESGTTLLQKDGNLSTNGLGSIASLVKVAANTYTLSGDLQTIVSGNPYSAFYASDDFNDNALGDIWAFNGTAGYITEENNRIQVNLSHTVSHAWNQLTTAIRTEQSVNTGLLVMGITPTWENEIRAGAWASAGIIKNGSDAGGLITAARIYAGTSSAGATSLQILTGGTSQYFFDTGIVATSPQRFKISYDVATTTVRFYHWNGASWDELDSGTSKVYDLLDGGTLDCYITAQDSTSTGTNDYGYFDDFIMHNADYAGLVP